MASPRLYPKLPSASATHMEEEDEDDIAATMGFASFGAKPNPPKKRKRGDLHSEGSGSNNTPLGVGGKQRQGQKMQSVAPHGGAGVRLGLEGEGNSGGIVGGAEDNKDLAYGSGRGTVPSLADDEDDAGPRYVEEDEDENEDDHEQLQMPLHQIKPTKPLATYTPAPTDPIPFHQQQGTAQEHRQGSGFNPGHIPGKRADGQWDWQALRKGVRDERGDMAYYDASFVEDPWAQLGREKGLS